MSDESQPSPAPQSSIVLYRTEDGRTRIQCRFGGDTLWLTQKLMAELFQKDVRTINEHIRNIFAEGELAEDSVIRNFRITAADGKTYETQHYNLEVIIAREQADALAEKAYQRFAARRRAQLEDEGQADTLKLLEDEVKKLPAPKKPKHPKP